MTTDRHYGPNCEKEDMSSEQVEVKADDIFVILEKTRKTVLH